MDLASPFPACARWCFSLLAQFGKSGVLFTLPNGLDVDSSRIPVGLEAKVLTAVGFLVQADSHVAVILLKHRRRHLRIQCHAFARETDPPATRAQPVTVRLGQEPTHALLSVRRGTLRNSRLSYMKRYYTKTTANSRLQSRGNWILFQIERLDKPPDSLTTQHSK